MKGGIVTELIRYAFAGWNIIPTVMFLLIQLYWLVAILGLFDFEFLDFDLDAEGVTGPLSGIAMFINIGKVPIALGLSLIVMNFWIASMMLYFLQTDVSGWLHGLLIMVVFILSLYVTRAELRPLRRIFEGKQQRNVQDHEVLKKRCILLTDLEAGLLGQAKVERKGASLVINVRTEFEGDVFKKNDKAFVFRKDDEAHVYYVAKLVMEEEFKFDGMEE